MQRNDHKDFEFVTLSCRVFGRDAKLVHRAAEAQRESAANYMRRVVLDHVAHELGLPASTYMTVERPAVMIAEAAKKRGLTTREFMTQAAREVAERDRNASLSIDSRVTQDPGPKRPAQPLGQVRRANHESGTRRRQG